MSLVDAAEINTPSRPSTKSASPSKASNPERDARRADSIKRFMQSANVSPAKCNKIKSRQSLNAPAPFTDLFGTPVMRHKALVDPKTAPPKQASFNLYANSFTGRLSPVKQMRMMPPLDTMNEEQEGSFRSENQQLHEEQQLETHDVQKDDEDSVDCFVIIEEFEQEQEQPEIISSADDLVAVSHAVTATNDVEDDENNSIQTSSNASTPCGSPNKSDSPKRAKRRSSFFGRAGPFSGMSLGFYAEERTDDKKAHIPTSEPQQASQVAEETELHLSDAPELEPQPMEEEELVDEAAESPTVHRFVPRSMTLGISKTPSPVKQQHFVGLTPLPRRPRLSLASRRKVSLRTQTLLRSSEAYADRLFLPPPPPTPVSNRSSGLSKSMSMPNNISAMASSQPLSVLEPSSTLSSDFSLHSDDGQNEQPEAGNFDAQLDPALSEHEAHVQVWKACSEGEDEDEDEVDQSLSVLSPLAPKTSAHALSPVKAMTLPRFATPQPASKTHSRRISMPLAGATDAKLSIRSALVRLQISGAGERIVHQIARKEVEAAATSVVEAMRSSPTKDRKVVRVSDVGLPATELSMGFDLVEDAAAEPESDKIAQALDDLFKAEEDELTDDEEADEDLEQQEDIVQISCKLQQSPSRPSDAVAVAPLQAPQTPAALNSVRHLFSAASAAPATPDMRGLGALLNPSPEKASKYGNLADKMRANPDIAELLSPSRSSPKKKAILGSVPSPVKGRRGVRRSQAAEIAAPAPVTPQARDYQLDPASPTVTSSLPSSEAPPQVQPAFEAELQVTMFDASAMDAENEALAQALAESNVQEAHRVEAIEPIAAEPAINDHLQEAAVQVQEPASLLESEELGQTLEPIHSVIEEVVHEAVVEEQEAAPVLEGEELGHVSESLREPETLEVVKGTEEAIRVPTADVVPVGAEQQEALNARSEEPAPVEASPAKTRTSRHAASASPVKGTARSTSPTKRALRSSPIKRSAAASTQVAPGLAPETETAQEETMQEAAVPTEQSQPENELIEIGRSSASKPARRTAARKAKLAATEAISTTLAPSEVFQMSSPVKATRRGKTAAAKKGKEERAHVEEGQESEQESGEVEQVAQDKVEEAPKRATRTRITRGAGAPAAKPVRAPRSRAAKTGAPALPSSSAGYGDDEASEEDVAAKTKRTTATRTRSTRTPAASRTKSTSRATKSTVLEASEPEAEAADADPSVQDDDHVESQEQPSPAKTSQTRAAATRTTRAKAATSAPTKAKPKAKAAAEAIDVDASASCSTTTTRSGRTTRRTVVTK